VGIAPIRVVEWRAAWFSDPVKRLQFLQRAGSRPGRANWGTYLIAGTLGLALASVAFVQPVWRRSSPSPKAIITSPRMAPQPAASPGPVWLVEANPQFELYSNGLQVEKQYLTGTEPRAYWAIPRGGIDLRPPSPRSEPAGIVFHTTESHMAPFEEDQNGTLKRAGEGLLEYVRRNHSYHFVIDRFGRVFRVVRESDYANHAGHSVWADQTWIYVNLNQSFFGVAFEAKSQTEDAGLPLTPAQVHAARILVEMLRARYKIPAANCVAHAQVSVNPTSGRAGFHTDWAANLPFRELGLGDNYQHPLPSVMLFGFGVDSLLAQEAGNTLRPALAESEALVRREAGARGIPLNRYREILQKRYRDAISASGRTNNVKYN
jgi:hypothetical protein